MFVCMHINKNVRKHLYGYKYFVDTSIDKFRYVYLYAHFLRYLLFQDFQGFNQNSNKVEICVNTKC